MFLSGEGQMPDKRWGWFTVLFVLGLAVCAWWVAVTKNPALVRCQFVVVELVLIGLCVVAGLMVHSRIDGILINDRNRLSLSRFQWVVWLVLILGTYFVESIWNTSQNLAFPIIQTQLLALLGISSGSAVASNVIAENKKTTPPPAAVPVQAPVAAAPANPATRMSATTGAMVVAGAPPPPPASHRMVGALAANDAPVVASWSDLFMGDEEATYRTVDISRLQKLVITVLLATIYLTYLWTELGKATSGTALAMPTFGDDSNGFLWLLGISHGAYLAQKATPKPA
jgi:hypothetical protein